jgi:hypothetical protein
VTQGLSAWTWCLGRAALKAGHIRLSVGYFALAFLGTMRAIELLLQCRWSRLDHCAMLFMSLLTTALDRCLLVFRPTFNAIKNVLSDVSSEAYQLLAGVCSNAFHLISRSISFFSDTFLSAFRAANRLCREIYRFFAASRFLEWARAVVRTIIDKLASWAHVIFRKAFLLKLWLNEAFNNVVNSLFARAPQIFQAFISSIRIVCSKIAIFGPSLLM